MKNSVIKAYGKIVIDFHLFYSVARIDWAADGKDITYNKIQKK